MVMVAAVTESGVEAAYWQYFSAFHCNTTQRNVVAVVMVRAVARVLAVECAVLETGLKERGESNNQHGRRKNQMQQSTVGDKCNKHQQTTLMTVTTGRVTSHNTVDVTGGDGRGDAPI